MFLLGFGGHPVLHHYNYMMYRRQREELLRQAEYERLARAAKLSRRSNGKSHRKWANWLGIHLVNWGQKLERFGTLKETQPSPMASPHH